MVHGRDASRTAAVGGSFLQEAKLLHDGGYGVLMIDLRGHGQSSDARFTFGLKERSDVLGAVDWLLQRGVAPGRIGVLGLSLGAAAAIGAAAEEPAIGALVLDSGFADINTLIGEQWEKASGLPRPFLYSALLMARIMTGVDLTAGAAGTRAGAGCPTARAAHPLRGRRLRSRGQSGQLTRCRPCCADMGHSRRKLPPLRRLQRRSGCVGRTYPGFPCGACRYDEISGAVSCELNVVGRRLHEG